MDPRKPPAFHALLHARRIVLRHPNLRFWQQLRPERGARSRLVVHVAPKPDLEYLDGMRSLAQGQQEDAVHYVVLVRLHLVSHDVGRARSQPHLLNV